MDEPVNHKCVQRLMQKMGLRALIRAKKRTRHDIGLTDVHVPNVLQRDFCATAPNQKWATDVTEFNVNGQKLYLSACMDLYNGEIVAHCMARRPVFELVSSTLQVALSRTKCTAKLDALEAGVHDYIHYYNHGRIKLGLQGLSPVDYRLRSTAQLAES